jgi:hypothetical protein
MHRPTEIPLFPLQRVLFPGGTLDLQIFEQRYLDMVAQCLKHDSGFGVILIEDGKEVLANAGQAASSVVRVGCYSRIIDFDQNQRGLLNIRIRGEHKFRVVDYFESASRLMVAEVAFLEMEPVISTTDKDQGLIELLHSLLKHPAVKLDPKDIQFGEAALLGGRLSELLPLTNSIRQTLLELKDPVKRLRNLERILDELQSREGG